MFALSKLYFTREVVLCTLFLPCTHIPEPVVSDRLLGEYQYQNCWSDGPVRQI